MSNKVQISAADRHNRFDGDSRKKSPPMLGRYVVFSVTLFCVILLVATVFFFFSMQQIIRNNKGRELAKFLELERTKLENYVDKEIAIILKMASSPLIRRYFENPSGQEIKKLADEEIDAYRNVLTGQIFWVSDIDKLFYFEDQEPHLLNENLPENYWYPMTLYKTEKYNFNINYNPSLNVTNLWINAPVFSVAHKPIGMLGAGFDLSAFIGDVYTVYSNQNHNAHFYHFNKIEEITGAEDVKLVSDKKSIREELGKIGEYVVEKAHGLKPGASHTFAVSSGQAAVISIPTLEWYAVAILPDSIDDYNTPLTKIFVLGILVIAFILVLSNIFIARILVPLRETMASLEEASKAKSDFLAKMSHEIRTPMNAILGVTQIQLEKNDLSDTIKSAFDIIHNSSTTLLNIINDILDMSKIETGKLTLNPIEYDTPSLICDVVQLNITRVGSKPIEFKLNVNENLPAKVIGDDLRLKQVLNNILSNSFKYTDSGSVILSISHSTVVEEVTLIFRIEDTGQGIKPDDLKKLFSAYQRLNTGVNRNIEGTGLGLNIAQRLVGMMDGKISVESEYGKGSAFTVIVKQKAVSAAGVIGAEYAKKLQNFSFASITKSASKQINRRSISYGSVLVVDDVETNLVIAEMMLAPYELKIDKVFGGLAAIEKVKGGAVYDIIFMDHMMPEMDGLEATKELRAMGYTGTIVALTANAIVGNREMFISSGFDDFISKPIDLTELDVILVKYICDKFTEKAEKVVKEAPVIRKVAPIKMNERFLNALKRDVQRAVTAMRESMAGGDIKLFTTTVHGLKSALAAIGENEKSQQARLLETAGRDNDTDFIAAHAELFIKALEELVENGK